MSTFTDFTLNNVGFEVYQPFTEEFSRNPTTYGTILPTGTSPYLLTNAAPVYEPDVNPPNAPDSCNIAHNISLFFVLFTAVCIF